MDFTVQILGPFALWRDGSPVDTGQFQRRPQTLLRLLATAPGNQLPREQVIETLWPDAAVEAGGSNLRYTLHLIRRSMSIDPPLVVASGGRVALNPEHHWTVDLDRFDELAGNAGDNVALLSEAVSLRRGEPLAEDRYEEWAVPVRERVERIWRELCLHLARLLRTAHKQDEAARWLERALESDPYDEGLLQELLRTMGELGRRAEALRRYDQFEQRLQSELDVSVSPETAAVAAALRTHIDRRAQAPADETEKRRPILELVPSYRLALSGPFLGRQAELSAIAGALAGHGPGDVRIVLVAADAGMGKTRMLGEVAERARRDGILTLAGGCYEQEGSLPFGPVHDALLDYLRALLPKDLETDFGDLLPDLARIVPEVGARVRERMEPVWSEAEDRRLRLFAAVAETLRRTRAVQPVVLLLDDLQWADESTIQLLHFLLRQSDLERMVIVGAYRPDDASAGFLRFAAEMEEAGWARTVQFEALGEEEMAAFLTYRLGDRCSPGLARAIRERSEGNPFFAGQMLRLLQGEGRLVEGPEGWEITAGGHIELPVAVRETIVRRVDRLGVEEQRVLSLGAVLGREFPYAALEGAWQDGPDVLFGALDAALAARLLAETEAGYAFLHPLLRESVYEATPLYRRKTMHERAGTALEAMYGARAREHAAELAWHFLQSGNHDKAAAYALAAGNAAAAAFAHDEAELHYGRALDLARHDADPLREAQILERIGATRMTLGRYIESLEALERAAGIYEGTGELEAEGLVVARIGEVHVRRETEREGIERLAPVVERMERAGPSPALAALYVTRSRLELVGGRYDQQLVAAERAVGVARRLDDTRVLAPALLARGAALGNMGRPEALDVILDVLPLAEAAEDNDVLFRARRSAGVALQARGALERGADHLEQALALAERMGDPTAIARIHLDLAVGTYIAGRWSETRRHIESVRARTRVSGPIGLRAGSLDFLVSLSIAQGNIDGAEHAAAEHAEIAEEWNNAYAVLTAQTLLAKVALARGASAAALERLEPQSGGPFAEKHLPYLLTLAEARSSSGEQSCALQAADAAVRLDADYHLWPYALDIRRVRGVILAGMERWEEAEEDFEAALQEAQALGGRYAEAVALLEWGLALDARGEGGARERLKAARTICEELGAEPCVRRAEAALGLG